MSNKAEKFAKQRLKQNEIVLRYANLEMKRYLSLDSQNYRDGALDRKTKELLGLVASLVLRCDDCIAYHLIQCKDLGFTDGEFTEAVNIGMIIGGTITIPHVRRAFALWDEMMPNTDDLLKHIAEIVSCNGGCGDVSEKLQNVCDYLSNRVKHYDWVGFYMASENDRQLKLGPFAGESTEHTQIGFGDGICGQAAETRAIFVVPDVEAQDNYLSCSDNVKSEIVLPIFKNEILVGELDIDSHELDAFGEWDEKLLSEVCKIVSELF